MKKQNIILETSFSCRCRRPQIPLLSLHSEILGTYFHVNGISSPDSRLSWTNIRFRACKVTLTRKWIWTAHVKSLISVFYNWKWGQKLQSLIFHKPLSGFKHIKVIVRSKWILHCSGEMLRWHVENLQCTWLQYFKN